MTEEGNDAIQDAADGVIEGLEGIFGNRWGGAWLSWEPREIGVGVVKATAEDAVLVARTANEAGWVGATVAVRYSAEQLEEFHDRLRGIMETSASIVMLGAESQTNKVRAWLNAFDLELIARLYAAVPPDALVVSVEPGLYFAPPAGNRS
jgi:hypothetical protein